MINKQWLEKKAPNGQHIKYATLLYILYKQEN